MMKLMLAGVGVRLAASSSASASPAALDFSALPGAVPTLARAYLGMTLAAWRALPRPAMLSAHSAESCSEDPADRELGGASEAAAKRRRPFGCSYLTRFGAVTLQRTLQLTPDTWRAIPTTRSSTDG